MMVKEVFVLHTISWHLWRASIVVI
jgi:hypothetical protein